MVFMGKSSVWDSSASHGERKTRDSTIFVESNTLWLFNIAMEHGP